MENGCLQAERAGDVVVHHLFQRAAMDAGDQRAENVEADGIGPGGAGLEGERDIVQRAEIRLGVAVGVENADRHRFSESRSSSVGS